MISKIKKKIKETKKMKKTKGSKKKVKKILKKITKKEKSKKTKRTKRVKKVKNQKEIKEKRTKKERPVKIFPPEKVEKLVKKGKTRGFVTFSELLYTFPEMEKDLEGLEELYRNLEDQGIEIKKSREFLDVKGVKSKPIRSSKIDLIQMYLREIGRTAFLTAKQEKELAKKIEKGDDEAKKNLAKANLRLVVSIAKKYVGRSPHLTLLD